MGYRSELSDDGYVDPDYTASTFIGPQAHFSPVIQFRRGYTASDKELQAYGDSVYLNEHAYWGGGPFANGCSSLPDLWGEGLSDALFLFIHIEHLNPVNDRMLQLRIAADWRLLITGNEMLPLKIFREYFLTGTFKELPLLDWVSSSGSTGSMPSEIVDERVYKRPETS
ncbi:T6SS effector phospholipase Tle3 domain-containing protein [Janthinobacterium sp. GB4P2]|uniref:T6SS effector phospholipase Tle3 domain-containing protein n=1 Tax=Janthinobacterium sp. GB4P2 TaxID=3424189 RepID=UPI003F1F29EF